MSLAGGGPIREGVADFLSALAHKSWGSKKRLAFYRRLAVYVENGIAPRDACLRLRRQAELRGGGWMAAFDPDRIALTELGDRLANGETLARALRDWAPATELSIIQAGEAAGALPQALRGAIAGSGVVGRIIGRILSESLDPLVMGALGFYLVYIVGTRLVGPMEVVAKPDTWPVMAKLLLPLAALSTSPWTVVATFAVVLLLAASFVSLPLWSGRSRAWVEKLPPWSVYRLIQGAQWMMGFSRLVAAGVPQVEALRLQSEFAGPWLKVRLLDAEQRMKNGRELGMALVEGEYGFPDRILADDISAFSGAADFSGLLESLAREWLEDGEKRILGWVRMVGLAANIGVNLLILLVVFGMYDLQNVMMAAAHA